jgi:predicted sugar kinase
MTTWLTIIHPGRNYGVIGATLRMPRLVLENAGADTAVIEYPPSANATRSEIVKSSSAQIAQLNRCR